jgi:hypothetical protein
VSILRKIGDFITRREPTDQLADESGEFGCNLCSDTGWVLCKCSDPCTCANYGEMRCPRGCAES